MPLSSLSLYPLHLQYFSIALPTSGFNYQMIDNHKNTIVVAPFSFPLFDASSPEVMTSEDPNKHPSLQFISLPQSLPLLLLQRRWWPANFFRKHNAPAFHHHWRHGIVGYLSISIPPHYFSYVISIYTQI